MSARQVLIILFPALFDDIVDVLSWRVLSFSLAKLMGFAMVVTLNMRIIVLGCSRARPRLHRAVLGILRVYNLRDGESGLGVLLEVIELQAQSLPGGHEAGCLGHIEEDNGCSTIFSLGGSFPRSGPNQLVVQLSVPMQMSNGRLQRRFFGDAG